MAKIIRIECKGHGVISLSEIEPIQGELKSLSSSGYDKLKNQILMHGFSAPFFLWKNPKKEKWSICDGTQRFRVLSELKNQGYEIPKLPYVEIFAKSELEAKKKLLSYVSQFGKVDRQGLYQYIMDSEIDVADLEDFDLPEVDLSQFKEEFFDGLSSGDESLPEESEDKTKQCPNCGHFIK